MIWFRKWLILIHRYLGIALSLLFVIWFLSGIGMIYAGGMPGLRQQTRLDRLPALDWSQVRISPMEAASHVGAEEFPGQVVLLTIMGRPAYRLGFGGTVFADTGEVLEQVGPAETKAIAARFVRLPESAVHEAGVVTRADQWTINQRRNLPLHKFEVDDGDGTELYVSPRSAEVVVHTTRGSRALAWVAAIPHWLYFTPLRTNDRVWQQVVIWSAALGTFGALIGLVLAVIQFAPRRPFRFSRIGSYIPYSGWMRWHYLTGLFFGVFALTWVFSGLLSMEPGNWASSGGMDPGGIQQLLAGGDLDLNQFPALDGAAWNKALNGRAAKEVEFQWIQGEPHFVVRGVEPRPLLLSAKPLQVRRDPFPRESVMGAVIQGAADVPIVEAALLEDYDSYYYSKDRTTPLPIVRVKFGDPDRSWLYIDPTMSEVVALYPARRRLERWIYRGFHSLDFSFWYYQRPLWDIGVIALSLGGATLSIIGVYIGFKRLTRRVKRVPRPQHQT